MIRLVLHFARLSWQTLPIQIPVILTAPSLYVYPQALYCSQNPTECKLFFYVLSDRVRKSRALILYFCVSVLHLAMANGVPHYQGPNESNYDADLLEDVEAGQQVPIAPDPQYMQPSTFDAPRWNTTDEYEYLQNRLDNVTFYPSLGFPSCPTRPTQDAAGESPLPSRGDSGQCSSRASPGYSWQLRDASASPSSKTSVEASYATLPGEEVRFFAQL